MKVALMVSVIFGCLLAVAQAGSGMAVEVVPSTVKPGELFELRVTMEREEFGRFELKIPGHDHLHRVAVEEVPVRLEDGRYRQQETWLLQADSSGEFVIDGGLALLETHEGIEEVKLEPIRVEVLPFATVDESSEPLEFPEEIDEVAEGGQVAWIIGGVLMALGCWWWMLKSNRTGVVEEVAGKSEMDLSPENLERLLDERDWSDEARQALSEVVYGGGKDVERVMEILRKEEAR
ncbi:hypothetical protein ACFQY0_06475 [Haloferula chungangensis]|uniref:Uncharacterized protein n=1 Tax=Haloferula chungangensis TaxID=1048331 RepID=A0ABW2L6C7_9BACT